MSNILVTGAVGFIRPSLIIKLLEIMHQVFIIHHHNNCHGLNLKESILQRFINNPYCNYHRTKIEDGSSIENKFNENNFESVLNLTTQAGVRFSNENFFLFRIKASI